MKQRLGHVCLGTVRLEAQIEFYCEVLQCELVHSFSNLDGFRYGAFLAVGEGSFLEFFHDESERGSGGRFRHLAFQVEDLKAQAQRLGALGLKLEVRRGTTDGALLACIEDPDGNEIEFHQYDEMSVQSAYLPSGEF